MKNYIITSAIFIATYSPGCFEAAESEDLSMISSTCSQPKGAYLTLASNGTLVSTVNVNTEYYVYLTGGTGNISACMEIGAGYYFVNDDGCHDTCDGCTNIIGHIKTKSSLSSSGITIQTTGICSWNPYIESYPLNFNFPRQ